jgi:hypothetical protein
MLGLIGRDPGWTIEATDNDQTSSGRQVLVGEVRAT